MVPLRRYTPDMAKALSIVVVEKDRERALMIIDGLRDAGDFDVFVIGEEAGLTRRIAERNPDLVLIDAGNPSRDALEDLATASAPMRRPVAMFVDQTDPAMTKAAIEAGMSAYVVDGLRPERLRPILDAAIARFHMVQKMRVELAETRRALEERKLIDRAKGKLMDTLHLTESEAHYRIQKASMDSGRRIADVAREILDSAENLAS